jgi:hypothetical protein
MDWLIYGGLVRVALIGFFLCLLPTAARADRRDAQTERRNARDSAPTVQPSTGRSLVCAAGSRAAPGARWMPERTQTKRSGSTQNRSGDTPEASGDQGRGRDGA